MDKKISLQDAAEIVKSGDTLALGGNVLHRSPMAFVRELVRQNKGQLKLVKTAGAHDVDLLCAVGAVHTVDAGFISYETKYGLAMHYRQAVQSGTIKANEHACYTVISALRAATINTPFMPVHGLNAGDLLVENDYFVVVEDPFGGEPVTLVKAIVPDVAIIHVQTCDVEGNAIIQGPKYEDILMSRAAQKVIITAEKVVAKDRLKYQKDDISIPGFLVDAVVHIPNGASPGSCYKYYETDDQSITNFLSLQTSEDIQQYVQSFTRKDYALKRVGL